MSTKVMVAMSGGVDSSVAALLLKEQGFDAVGVTMCFNIAVAPKNRPSCCGLEGIEDARRVAQQLNIPHYVFNFGPQLKKTVVADFLSEYLSGRTPNPCARCNQHLKFGLLLTKARQLGIPYLATGHFARLEKRKRTFFIKKGRDEKKDQSYFLCLLERRSLARCLFPLGGMTKEEARALAEKKGLGVARKPASQEVCFIPDNDYRAFVRNRLGSASRFHGDIVDKAGRVLGRHEGVFNFTVGQRAGLGVAGGRPFYVLKIEGKAGRVTVGGKEDVYSQGLLAAEPNLFIGKDALRKEKSLTAKIRYHHPQSPCRADFLGAGEMRVDFALPQASITPGQFVALYRDDILLAGAKIISSQQ